MDSRIKIVPGLFVRQSNDLVSILVLMDSRIKMRIGSVPTSIHYRFNPCFNG